MKEKYQQAPAFTISEGKMLQIQDRMKLMTAIFRQVDGNQGNLIKIMLMLINTKGDGSFRISEKWMLDNTGLTHKRYISCRQELCNRGWISMEKGESIVLHPETILDESRPDHARRKNAVKSKDNKDNNMTCHYDTPSNDNRRDIMSQTDVS